MRRNGLELGRREFIAFVGGAAASWPLAAKAQKPGNHAFVYEVTMAAPDIVCVVVRDPPVAHNGIVKLPSPAASSLHTWIRHKGTYGFVIGPNGDHVRLQDDMPSDISLLNRAAMDNAGAFGQIGGKTVTGVYRKSKPYDYALLPAGRGEQQRQVHEHHCFLKLNGNLGLGGHTIIFPKATGLADANFIFNDRNTRSLSIQVAQTGYSTDDKSKLAYLSLWVPVLGAIDFSGSYGITSFHIIDAEGKSLFTAPLKQRVTPDTPEEGVGTTSVFSSSDGLMDYPDEGTVVIVTNITRTNPPVVTTATAHGAANGEGIWLSHPGTPSSLRNLKLTAANVSDTTLEISGVDGRTFPRFSGSAKLYRNAHQNRARTFVYGLDFGSWSAPREGTYRIYIPGLGVSDAFRIDDAVHFRMGRAFMNALGAHHLGRSHDGSRGGWNAPVAMKPGMNGFKVWASQLPYAFSSECIGGSLGVDFTLGAIAPWVTSREVHEAWGGYKDAGDNDRRILSLPLSVGLLTLYEILPAAAKRMSLAVANLDDMLSDSRYAGLDLPDLVKEALWNIDLYRRMQDPVSGGCRGHIEQNAGPSFLQPPWLETNITYASAPDHYSSYTCAAAFAKAAIVLKMLGYAELAATYETAAEKAWNFSEPLFAQPAPYYANVKTLAKWDDKRFNDAVDFINTRMAEPARIWAASTLYRLTGGAVYKRVAEEFIKGNTDCSNNRPFVYWEYINCNDPSLHKGVNKRYQLQSRDAFANYADANYLAPNYDRAKVSYVTAKFKDQITIFGGGNGLNDLAYIVLMLAHNRTRNEKYLNYMQQAVAHTLGANQMGMCQVAGVGNRAIKIPLHVDSISAGVAPPAGLIPEGYCPWVHLINTTIVFEAGFGALFVDNPVRRVDPYYRCWPYWESIVDNYLLVNTAEYTVQQNIGPMAISLLYLAGHKGEKSGIATK